MDLHQGGQGGGVACYLLPVCYWLPATACLLLPACFFLYPTLPCQAIHAPPSHPDLHAWTPTLASDPPCSLVNTTLAELPDRMMAVAGSTPQPQAKAPGSGSGSAAAAGPGRAGRPGGLARACMLQPGLQLCDTEFRAAKVTTCVGGGG